MMSNPPQHLVRVGLFMASLVVFGCGQRELSKKDTFPAQGRLLLNGEPVRFALIELEPVEGKGAHADARTDAEGAFQVRTYSNEGPDGAVPGEYNVAVDPGKSVPFGYNPKTAPIKATDVPPESRKAAATVIIEAKDNDLEITLP